MAIDRSNVTERREDYSRFVVHFTRNDKQDFTKGSCARDNFTSIIKDMEIKAYKAHCLHGKQIKKLPEARQESFFVACFTEVPLNQLHLLIQPVQGRRVQLEPYGLVFTKQFLIEQGAQPAIYINSYGQNLYLRSAVNRLYEIAIQSNSTDDTWRLLPFINAMHENYDFTWEREWRVLGD